MDNMDNMDMDGASKEEKEKGFGRSGGKVGREAKMSKSSTWSSMEVDKEILAAERALKEKALNRAKETPPPHLSQSKKMEKAKAKETQSKETPKKDEIQEVALDSEKPSGEDKIKKPEQKEIPPEKKKEAPAVKKVRDGEEGGGLKAKLMKRKAKSAWAASGSSDIPGVHSSEDKESLKARLQRRSKQHEGEPIAEEASEHSESGQENLEKTQEGEDQQAGEDPMEKLVGETEALSINSNISDAALKDDPDFF